MATIKRKGAPTKSTEGFVGDTYIDLDDCKSYKCVSVFKDSLGGAEYEWKYVSDIKQEPEQKREKEVSPEDEKPEVVEQPEEQSRNNNYHKPYKKQYHKQYNGQNNK